MQVKNVSSRPHWIGDVLIAPGETKEINRDYANSINKDELVAIESEAKEQKKSKKSKEVEQEVDPIESGEADE